MKSTVKKIIHWLFEITISIKGISGIVEIVSGSALLLKPFHFSHGTRYFIAYYLLFYGIVNMFLVISLLWGKLWAYPTAIVCFLGFTSYMVVRFWFNHSSILSLFIIFDMYLITLTWLEYKRVKERAKELSL